MSLREEVTTENDISEVPVVSTTTSSALYDRKRHSKAIRVLTVLAYVLSVSLAAIILSIYYIFVWDGHPTMAAKNYPQAQTAADYEILNERGLPEVSKKRDVSNFLNENGSIRNGILDNHLYDGSIDEHLDNEISKENNGYNENENEKEEIENGESLKFSEYNLLNDSEKISVWLDMNSSLSLDEYGNSLAMADPTIDYEDSTYYTTPPPEENSTWFSELEDLNSDYGILNKRSVFIKKLLGHRKVMSK